MIRTLFTLAFLLLTAVYNLISSQEVWTLERCITYAVENNIQIRQSRLAADYQQNMLKDARNARLPGLNSQLSQNFNFGRSLTYLNTYQNVNSSQSDLGVSANMNLFKGLQVQNTVKKNELDLEASMKDLEAARDAISVNIASTFLEILFAKELVKVSDEQIVMTRQQLAQSQTKVDAGSMARGALLEIEAQLAREELNLVDAKNQLQLAKLKLAQLLEINLTPGFDIQVPQLPEVENEIQTAGAEDIYNIAVAARPEIKSAELKQESAHYQLKIARGALYPTIGMYASYYNNYNNKYSDINGNSISFGDQIRNNQRKGFGVQMSIPIFNQFQARTGVSNAEIQQMRSALDLENTKKQLRQEIESAYTNSLAALNRYNSSKKAVESMREAFRYSEEKYNVGMVNALDYNNAKTNLIKASSDLLRSKYEYLFRIKILDFYQGKPLTI